MDIKQVLEKSAQPHLIASAKEANTLLSYLNGHISDLRLEVSELELKADLYLNELLKNGKGVEMQKSNWKVSEIYKEWKKKAGLLADVRAVRRNLERHCDLLMQQEKFTPKNSFPSGGF